MMEIFSKTKFQQAYQLAMSQQAPKEYRAMMKAGTFKDHLREVGLAALSMYEETVSRLTEDEGAGDEAKFIAAEVVFAEMIRF